MQNKYRHKCFLTRKINFLVDLKVFNLTIYLFLYYLITDPLLKTSLKARLFEKFEIKTVQNFQINQKKCAVS